MNKEFNRMLKLAGLMTEGLYTNQMTSEEPVMEAPMKKMTKEKLKAKIKEMMLPEETIGQEAYAEMGSMDEYDTQGLTNAASVVDHYLKMAYDAGSMGSGFDNNLGYDMMDHLKQFSGEMDGMNEDASDISNSVSKSSVEVLVSAAKRIIGALRDSGFEQEDIYDYIMDKVKTLSVDETLFEAKKDEEEAPEEVAIDVEAPVEDVPDAVDTSVDVNMDGVPDVDTGSSESKKAFTNLVDTYNAAKELGDPKLTQMIANALTYYNKNIILKAGQPQI